MNRHYDIHGIFRFIIENSKITLLEDLNWKYSFFEKQFSDEPDLIIKIGKFIPQKEDCYCIDHKYYIKRNYIYFKDEDKRMNWEVEISGIELPPLIVKFLPNWKIRLKFPWNLFPYLILHNYIIDPLMELKIIEKGSFLLHSGAVVQNGFAHLFAGRGGSYKTTCVMELIRRGFKFMSDDFVLIKDNNAYCLPTFQKWFSFNLNFLNTEEMNLFDKIRLFKYLIGREKPKIELIKTAKIKSITLLLVTNTDKPRIKKEFLWEDVIQMAGINHQMEKTSYVSLKYMIGQFLQAYEMVFPEVNLTEKLFKNRSQLAQHLSGVKTQVFEIPKQWNPDFIKYWMETMTI